MSKDVDPHDETRAPEADAAVPRPLVAGAPLGNYELREVLGEGGMGVVWRAHDPKLDREVAIKVLKRMDAPASLRQRLQREARAMARLKHPNVLTVYDAGTQGGRDFIAMELVEGCSLDVWIGRLPMDEDVIATMLAAGRGLAAAHRAGLVHRDFKPHNVLRSNDGRVLVTDFGLARGLGETSEDGVPPAMEISGGFDQTVEASASGRSSKADSVLDSPLTQTGVLIGTPAYMAPEQFEGALPDPRTDQFAFCVTAWQLLTGARPYGGANLEELRAAASGGMGHLKSTLAPAVRAALVRGMDPDPAKRWPDMDALLGELDRATRPKRPRWLVPAIAGAMVLALVIVGVVVRRVSKSAAVEARVCQAADVAFGDAWSPEVRAAIWKDVETRGVSEAAFARVADPFDAWRTAWMQSYDEACRATADKLPRAKLNCLFGARDTVGALKLVVRGGPAPMFEAFDAYGILPNVAVCDVPNPPPTPQIPVEQRDRILDVMARAFTLRMQPDVDAAADALIADASKLSWQPLQPMVMMGKGNELLRRGDAAAAREVYGKAIALARPDVRLLATLRLGMLEASITELEAPDTPIRTLPAEIAALVSAARTTAKTAGDDPMLTASTALLEGMALTARARWTYDKRLYADALATIEEAKRLYTAAGDLRRAGHAAAAQAELYMQRADERALDDAMFVTRSAEETLERAKLPPSARLDEIQARIAFARGDFGEARTRFAKLARHAHDPSGDVVSGTVVGLDGKPVGEATVIAWTGDMDGDPQNLVTDARTLDGDVVQTASDGTFTIRASAGTAIVAQRGQLRTAPHLAIGGPLVLHLEPTNVISGRIDGRDLGGVVAFVQTTIGDATWRIRVPAHRDGTYAIGGQPKGTWTLGASNASEDSARTVLAVGRPPRIEWPHGRAVEVIVRGTLGEGAQVWLFPGRITAPTRADADQLVRTSTRFAIAQLHPIGATATPSGRELYHRGDRHTVVAGNPPAVITACAAADDRPATKLTCVEAEVTDGEVTDFPDGRWGAEPQALLIELH